MSDQTAPHKPFRHRHDGLTPARQAQFCQALSRTGFVSHAAREVGVSVNSCRRARGRMPAFARAWDRALADARAPETGGSARTPLQQLVYDAAVQSLTTADGAAAMGRASSSVVKLALDQERAATTAPVTPERRATAEQTDEAILRKLAAMTRARRHQEVAVAKRLLSEGKIP